MTQPPSLIERRMRNANPVPNPENLPATSWHRDVARAEIDRLIGGQPDIARDYDRRLVGDRVTRRRAIWAASASFLAVALVGLVIYLTGAGGTQEPPVVTTLPPTTTTTSTTTTSTATASTTNAPTSTAPTTTAPTTTQRPEIFPGIPKFGFGPLEPGPTAVEVSVAIPFAFTVPDVTADFPRGLWVTVPGNPGPGIVPRDAIDPNGTIDYPDPVLIFAMTRTSDSVDEVVGDIASELNPLETGETEVGGHRAVRLDVGVIETGIPLLSLGVQSSGEPQFGVIDGSQHRFYVVETPDGTLVIWFDIWAEAWDLLSPYYEAIVDTIEFSE